MAAITRDEFEDYDAATATKPQALLVGITAPSSGGKTWSALALASGMVKVTGGDVYLIDTEADRALHYKDKFAFRHVPFKAPHSPERYAKAIQHCLTRGAKVIIVDSMTHEHSGEGGVLDQMEEYTQRKIEEKRRYQDFDEQKVRDAQKWAAQIEPKRQRKMLNNMIEQVGARAIMIFCYRADDKTKPGPGGKPVHIGWSAETTSKLPYMMTVRFLLPPGSDGKPSLNPETDSEKLSIKMPSQFRDWFKPGVQLNADIGRKLAEWAAGGAAHGAQAIPSGEANTPAVREASPGLAPDQLEEIQRELGRLRWTTRQIRDWCQAKFGVDWIKNIPADKGVAAFQDLAERNDP